MDRIWNGDYFMIKKYALIENDVVVNTIIADAEFISQQSGQWIEYTDSRPAYIGVELVDGVLVAPKPFPSWSLNEDYVWVAPVVKPDGDYVWNEESLSWVEPYSA